VPPTPTPPTGPWRILSLAPAAPERVAAWFDGIDGIDLAFPRTRTAADVRAAITTADIVISDWSSALHVGRAELDVAPRLAFVQSAAVGLDSLDLGALTEAGIVVANPAGKNARSVAEWCLAAALSVARLLPWVDDEIRAGRWPQLELPARGSLELEGRRVGVIGHGAVGSRVAGLFAAIGCQVGYWSRTPRPDPTDGGPVWTPLDELVASSDILVVNIALTEDTRGLLGEARLARLPEGAILVDASRGGVVDLGAVVAKLESGHLRGAAIDVFETEPLPLDHPIRRSDRVLLSSHAAATTAQSIARIFGLVRANVARVVAGEPVESVVNGLDPLVRRRG
jgi:phosphoglycerate dehydrogenase-like enzyme